MLRHGGILFFHDFMDNEDELHVSLPLLPLYGFYYFYYFYPVSDHIILYNITTFSLTVSQRHGMPFPSPI